MAQDLTIAERLELVRAAIEKCAQAEERHQKSQASPYTSQFARAMDWEKLGRAEKEFGWQWKNVRAILDAISSPHQQSEEKP